ncbi:hypothetical protein [Paenibacillus daejeonensis]|uniref:hypothetical protein n=1 Tax=Paenibacillus daejeonensis TaxID=135193 RepID=UPI00035DF54E|nr:hypothetical protein [Paenibacillus daejeonensis]
MTEIDWIDWGTLLLYIIAVGCATYVILAHAGIYIKQFKVGHVYLFIMAMFFFLVSYDTKMLVAVWMRSSDVFGYRTYDLERVQRVFWMVSQIGTTSALVIMAWLTKRKAFNLRLRWIEKIHDKGDE